MDRSAIIGGVVAVMLVWGVAAPSHAEEVTLLVTSMKTNTINVFRGRVPDLAFVRGIGVGRGPHNLGISPAWGGHTQLFSGRARAYLTTDGGRR